MLVTQALKQKKLHSYQQPQIFRNIKSHEDKEKAIKII